MEEFENAGTGDYYCTVPEEVRVALNNTLISESQIGLILGLVSCKTKVYLMTRTPRHRWGTAFKKSNRILLYRPSVWTFLHELAHILTEEYGHGLEFGKKLDTLCELWLKLI